MGGDGRSIEPQIESVEFSTGDAFALRSDGLVGPLREPPALLLVALLAVTPATAEGLIAAANAAGGPDNITVLLATVVADGAFSSSSR